MTDIQNSVKSSIQERMQQAIIQHNAALSKQGEAGTIKREDMNLKSRVDRVELTTVHSSGNRVTHSDKSLLSTQTTLGPLSNDDLEEASVSEKDIQQFIDSLPRADRSRNQFLLKIRGDEGEIALFCVQELLWPVAINIGTDSYRMDDEDEIYFSEETERRETLREAIVWVADLTECQLIFNNTGGFLNQISDSILNHLWTSYEKETVLHADDASQLYETALAYFKGESDGMGLHPMIHEVDLLFKVGGLSKADIRSYTKLEFDRFKIIERARQDAINQPKSARQALNNQVFTPTQTPSFLSDIIGNESLPPELFPDHVRNPKNNFFE